MRDIILSVFLFSLVFCPYPGSTEGDFEPKRREINKKLSNQIKECILNQKITKLFREKIDANPDEDLNDTTYDQLIGKVEYHIPTLGIIGSYIDSSSGKLLIGEVIVIAAMLHIVSSKIKL